jgi:hypothetical protein
VKTDPSVEEEEVVDLVAEVDASVVEEEVVDLVAEVDPSVVEEEVVDLVAATEVVAEVMIAVDAIGKNQKPNISLYSQ